jgi:hypothetical protein
MRDTEALNDALFALQSDPYIGLPPDDHGADAIVTAAWMRNVAPRPSLWKPAPLNRQVAATEGWTFGVI